MDLKELNLLRFSPRWFKLWSVICLHLLTSQQTSFLKAICHSKERLRDCKEHDLLRFSPRLFRPWSVICLQLLVNQQKLSLQKSLPSKFEIDGSQRVECFETFDDSIQTLEFAPRNKSINSYYKHYLHSKVEINTL